MTEENAKDFDAKFEVFEKKMEKKHGELIDNLYNLLQGASAVLLRCLTNLLLIPLLEWLLEV